MSTDCGIHMLFFYCNPWVKTDQPTMGGHPYTRGNDPHSWVCGCGSLVGVGVGWHLKPMGSPTQITTYRVINIYYSVMCYTNYINSTRIQSIASMALMVFPDGMHIDEA